MEGCIIRMKKQVIRKRILSVLLLGMTSAMCAAAPVRASSAKQEEDLETIESAEAATMQLMKTEGDVTVSNVSGRNVSVIENMRLYNGYHTDTDEASYAWINLDSEKLLKQDAVSETEVRKNGKKLEILLKSGNLFFDVKEPLEEEETLNVRTSTMVVGIRGTSGWVKVLDRWRSRVYVLEGTVTCYVADPVTGQIKSTTLSGGETAEFVVYEEDQNGERCDILRDGFSEDEIDGFVLTELAGDNGLCQKIRDGSDLDISDAAARAGERLAADEAQMKTKLDAIWEQYGNQESHISRDPVWIDGLEPSGTQTTGTQEKGGTTGRIRNPVKPGGSGGTGTSGGSGSSGGGGSSSGGNNGITNGNNGTTDGNNSTSNGNNSTSNGNTTPPDNSESENPPPPPVTLTDGTDPIDTQSLQNLLNSADVGEIVVKKNPNPPTHLEGIGSDPIDFIEVPDPTVVQIDSDFTIPEGKTLTLEDEVQMVVEEGSTITIDGTLNAGGVVTNYGTIIVNNSD